MESSVDRGSRRWPRLAAGVVVAGLATLLSQAVCGLTVPAHGAEPSRPIALPGASRFPPDLNQRLASALAARGPDYKPRTRHLNPDGTPQYTNRLILEDSPYLLQHAHNPVDWYPWGDEAFERARAEGKPVLLSVGYSTCHWCHVMERESFENPEIAGAMNASFVNVKVDREERPDVDHIYMQAVQSMTGHGGWPMTVFLTPEGTPFYGGTYFPPQDRHGLPGFPKLLAAIAEAWRSRRGEGEQSARELTASLRQAERPRRPARLVTEEILFSAVHGVSSQFDEEGG